MIQKIKNYVKNQIILISSLTLAVSLSSFYYFGFLQEIENIYNDWLVVSFSKPKHPEPSQSNVVYALTTQRGLNEAQQIYNMGWPWRRATYSKIVDFLNQSGAKVIIFDAIFSEKSVYSYLGEKDDQNFANSIKNSENVIIANFFNRTQQQLAQSVSSKTLQIKNKYQKILQEKLKNENPNSYPSKELLNQDLNQKLQEILFKNTKKTKNPITPNPNQTLDQTLLNMNQFIKNRHVSKMKKSDTPQNQKFAVPISSVISQPPIPTYYEHIPPYSKFYESVHSLGTVQGLADSDNIVRRTPLLSKYFDHYYPALSLAAAEIILKPKKITLSKQNITFDDLNIPLTQDGYLLLNFYGTSDVYPKFTHIDILRVYDHINAIYDAYSKTQQKPQILKSSSPNPNPNPKKNLKSSPPTPPQILIPKSKLFQHSDHILEVRKSILESDPQLVQSVPELLISQKAPPQAFKDKVVIIGDAIPGHFDLRGTPFNTREIGAHIHGTAIDNILHQDILVEYRQNIPLAILVFSSVLLSFFILKKVSILWGILWTFSSSSIVFLSSFILYYYYNILTDTTPTVLAIFLTFPIVTGISYFKENKQKKYIQNAFNYYLSPKVIELIIQDPGKLNLGGTEREITAFFSDVAGFTSISESLTPKQLVQVLNEYLTYMGDIIAKHDGVIDKFEGDAIISFWGAPLIQKDHATRACLASIEMQESLFQLREQWKQENKPLLKTRIGINSGKAVIGNMGSKHRMDYTMIGDSVNLASRLEGANKIYSSFTLISNSTYQQAQEYIDVRELDTIRVVGKNVPVTIYELIAKKNQTHPVFADCITLYCQGLDLYKQKNFSEAIQLFQNALKVIPHDGPSQEYIARCEKMISNPPTDDWDGVFTLSSK